MRIYFWNKSCSSMFPTSDVIFINELIIFVWLTCWSNHLHMECCCCYIFLNLTCLIFSQGCAYIWGGAARNREERWIIRRYGTAPSSGFILSLIVFIFSSVSSFLCGENGNKLYVYWLKEISDACICVVQFHFSLSAFGKVS